MTDEDTIELHKRLKRLYLEQSMNVSKPDINGNTYKQLIKRVDEDVNQEIEIFMAWIKEVTEKTNPSPPSFYAKDHQAKRLQTQ